MDAYRRKMEEKRKLKQQILSCKRSDGQMSSAISRPLSVFQLGHIVLLVSVYLVTARVVSCVRINSISPPQSFRSGSANSVILDCDFTLSEDDSLVVVKWFLNDEKQHIYQWIQSKDLRIYSPKIKPYVDETFVVSDHPTRHRALRLLNPPASLSGKYTCSVSSLANEDTNSTTLVIFEPPKSFDIAAVEVDEDRPEEEGFNITCTVIGVFPEPEIKLYKVRSNKENLVSDELQSNTTTILSFLSVTDGLYSLTLVTHIEPTNSSHINSSELLELETPSRERLALGKYNQTKTKKKKNFAEHYECKLTIPNSDFTEVRRLAIQDGWRSKYRSNGAQSLLFAHFVGHRLFLGLFTVAFTVRALAIGGHHRML